MWQAKRLNELLVVVDDLILFFELRLHGMDLSFHRFYVIELHCKFVFDLRLLLFHFNVRCFQAGLLDLEHCTGLRDVFDDLFRRT